MAKRPKKLKIYYLPLLIALIIGISQFVLSSKYTLTRWEGGGFGMYSEPSPDTSRIVGISINNPDGKLNLQLSPPDEKISLYFNKIKGEKRDVWDKLIEDTERIRRFPKYALTDTYIRQVSEELLDINYNLKSAMRSNNSSINVNVYVIQLSMNVEDKSVETRVLYSKNLDI